MHWEPDDAEHAYQSVAERRKLAEERMVELLERGEGPLHPVQAKGKKMAASFWGQAWNRNLENYQQYEHRLPRGRSYVRHGQVIDLKVEKGAIDALVSGARLHEVSIQIRPLDEEHWEELKQACAGKMSSLVDLLKGKLPEAVMRAVTDPDVGLFPEPGEIRFDCDCEDHANLCEHAAAAAYGLGVRLDEQPEWLFVLRGVDASELVEGAQQELISKSQAETEKGENWGEGDLEEIFGIELDGGKD